MLNPNVRLIELLRTFSSPKKSPTVLRDIQAIVLNHYEEPHRKYHTLSHVTECIDELDRLVKAKPPGACPLMPSLIELALWFHDVIYDPSRKDNEEKSAELASLFIKELEGPIATEVDGYVHRLIMATKHQPTNLHGDEAIIVDLDLFMLATDPATFHRRNQAIGMEYAEQYSGYTDAEYRRKAFLKSMLQRQSIFLTPYYIATCEMRARQNLQAALDELQDA
jgi:predicted metal-dependent HD superfamily phosphohydrolase